MQENRVIVSLEEWLSGNKKLNLHITVGLLSFMMMVFHFTSVYFFTLQLGSLAMVGIFLWLGNLFAFFFDIPIGILQYYFRSKTLYAFWVTAQIIAMCIFANFIFSITGYVAEGIVNHAGVIEWLVSFFLFDGLNILLMVIAAMCYGFAKEVNDITTISYVLNNAHPSQYKSIFATNNIFLGAWSFCWLFLSWFILTFAPKLIIVSIILMILLVFSVMYLFFDNSNKVINTENITNFHLDFRKLNLKSAGENVSRVVNRIDIKKALENTKYVVFKPVRVEKENKQKLPLGEMVTKTKASFKDIYETLGFSMESHMVVYWSFIMLLTFGFWDTFASTFLIDFLNQVKPGWSFVLLGIIAIPAFWLQDMFWKLADKIGVFKIAGIWLVLSGTSLVTMAFFAGEPSLTFVMPLALMNSVGYAICMSLSVATFLESYNIAYADRKGLKQIDANASAAPMKILQNMANVVGLFLGWMILWFAGFSGFFFVFGLFILGFFTWSILWKKKIWAS